MRCNLPYWRLSRGRSTRQVLLHFACYATQHSAQILVMLHQERPSCNATHVAQAGKHRIHKIRLVSANLHAYLLTEIRSSIHQALQPIRPRDQQGCISSIAQVTAN